MTKAETQRNHQSDNSVSLTPTVICKSFTLHGSIKRTYSIRIEGTIIGNIEQADTVVIGETGIIQGNVNTKKLVVFGHIEGDVLATESVTIAPSGQIVGKLITQSLNLDHGAVYDGEIIMRSYSS